MWIPNKLEKLPNSFKKLFWTGMMHSDNSNYKNRLLWIRNGRIGIEAFYLILEGIVRNSVKHRKQKNIQDKLEISIILFDEFDSISYYIQIDSQKPNDADKYYYCAVVCNFDKKTDELQKRIKGFLNEPIINYTGEIDSSAWGIKEIKIAACYLSNESLEKVNNENVDYLFTGSTNISQKKSGIGLIVNLGLPLFLEFLNLSMQ